MTIENLIAFWVKIKSLDGEPSPDYLMEQFEKARDSKDFSTYLDQANRTKFYAYVERWEAQLYGTSSKGA